MDIDARSLHEAIHYICNSMPLSDTGTRPLPKIYGIVSDVTDPRKVEEWVQGILAHRGYIDGFVNAAGMYCAISPKDPHKACIHTCVPEYP